MYYKFISSNKNIASGFKRVIRNLYLLKNMSFSSLNYNNRMPEFSNIPITSNNYELSRGLLKKTFKDFNYLKISNNDKNSEEKFIQDVVFFTQKDDQFDGNFIENFPLNLDMAKRYDLLTNGINLFINFNFVNLNEEKLMVCQNCGSIENQLLDNNVLLGSCEKTNADCDFISINKSLENTSNFKNIVDYYKKTGVFLDFQIDMNNFDLDEVTTSLKKDLLRTIKN